MAQNGIAVPDLPEAVSKPPEGIVLPPKDIRGKLLPPLMARAQSDSNHSDRRENGRLCRSQWSRLRRPNSR